MKLNEPLFSFEQRQVLAYMKAKNIHSLHHNNSLVYYQDVVADRNLALTIYQERASIINEVTGE